MTEYDFILRLVLALVFGGVIGIERKRVGKAAGFRTQMMVCLGSALFTILSFYDAQFAGFDNVDPSRIAAGIVVGIGFLGAGTIIHSQGEVVGLTTAAGIWVVAAIGMALGLGLFVLAGVTTILSLFILFLMEKAERRFKM